MDMFMSMLAVTGEGLGMGVGLGLLGLGLGMGLLVFGAAKGIGNIGANATQAMARQPEAGPRIFLSMLIAAALIEGFTFFAIVMIFLMNNGLLEMVGKAITTAP